MNDTPPPPRQSGEPRPDPPGWQTDPIGTHTWRWWDGNNWTDRTADVTPAAAAGGSDAPPPEPEPQGLGSSEEPTRLLRNHARAFDEPPTEPGAQEHVRPQKPKWRSWPVLLFVLVAGAVLVFALTDDATRSSEGSSYEDKMAAITTDQFCLTYEEVQAAGGYALMREQATDAYAKRSGLSDDDARFVMVEAIERCADNGFEVGP